MDVVTAKTIEEEFRDFARTHMASRVNTRNVVRYKDAYDAYIEALDFEADNPLNELNLSGDDKARFLTGMNEKYGESFFDDRGITIMIDHFFTLIGGDCCHGLKLDGGIGFAGLLMQIMASAAEEASLPDGVSARLSFFRPEKEPGSAETGIQERPQSKK